MENLDVEEFELVLTVDSGATTDGNILLALTLGSSTDNDDWEIYLWSLRSKHLYRGVLKEFEDFTNMETVMIRYSLGEVRCNGCGEWVDLHQVDRVRYGTFCRESEECEEKYREALEYDKLRG